ncbi:MAG: S8 family serine peptidase, partial [Candidatus Pacearchaeota archaeon]|nr:S8 family serine peptidase [Candidatus Pacearchaeota archaeon]
MHTKPNNYGTILLVILIVILISILLINKGIYSEDKTGKVISEDIYSPDLKANQFSYLAASYDYYNPAIPENTSLYDGYIIEFEDDPVIVEQGKLANKAKENADKIEDNSEFIKNIRGAFLLMPEDVEGKVEEYSLNIKDNNEGTKARILSELGESEESSGISGNAIQNRINTNSEVNLVFNGIAMDITDEEAKKIKNVKGVKKVYPNYKVNITLMDSVPMIGADDVWKLDANGNNCSISGEECLTGKGVTIGIIDTGVDYTHPDLGGCFGEGCKVIGGYDFVNNDVDPMDDNGHGTHVAATAAGKGILKGVAPDAKLYAFKVLNSEGSGEAYDIIQAITRTIDLDNDGIPMENENDYLDIVSLSLGGPGNPDDPMSLAIDSIVDAGVVAVIAAGNSGPEYSTIGSPGTSRKAITVGAVDKTNQIAYFSSRGPVIWTGTDGKDKSLIKPDVTAPGVNICAAEWASAWSDRRCLDNKHIAISGTSMATPHVAGVVALLKQKHPDWTPAEIKNSLKYSAKANIAYGSNVQGYGLVDVLNLINLNKSIPVVWDFGITSPLEPLMETNKSIEIKGIFPENYESLKVRYHNELNSIWSSAGITIVGINSTIAIISPLVSSNGGKYIFEIEIKKDGIIKTETISYSFDSSLMKGNPIKINSQAWMDFPILEDLNNDSVEELIFSTMPEGLIYVINSNLENLPGWPKQIGSFGADTPPGGSPSVADLDNDGVKDIVLVSGYSGAGRPGYLVKSYVYAFHLNGDSFRGFPVAIELSDPLHLPTIYDINNDGKPEIIVTTGAVAANTLTNEWYENRKIYVINNKGEFLTNWPVETTNTLKPLNGASIIDLDN